MKKNILILTLLFSAFFSSSHANILGPIDLGMSEMEVTQLLNSYPGVEPPGTETIMGNTSSSSNYTTSTPFCGSICELTLEYSFDKLTKITFNSTETFDIPAYNLPFRSRYKQLAMEMTARYGPPANIQKWPSPKLVAPGKIVYLHIWKVAPNMAVMTGIGNEATGNAYSVSCKFMDAQGNPLRYPPVKKEILDDWAKIPEFYELKKAEKLMTQGMNALIAKKAESAVKCFEKAAELGSGRAYWGLATLYEGGRGIPSNRKKATLCQQRAASLGYAASVAKVDRNFDQAMKKLSVTPIEAKCLIARIQRAAQEGCASEQYNLGLMYKNGFGVAKDLEEAKKWIETAAKQGDKQAIIALKTLTPTNG
ncbi:MAG: tetratricopeptide repeat protein [Akkermansia sp.]